MHKAAKKIPGAGLSKEESHVLVSHCKMHALMSFLFSFFKLIYLFLAALRLCCCVRAFSSCSEQGLLFVAVRGLLVAVASLVAEHRL